jgi:hypothetical protein
MCVKKPTTKINTMGEGGRKETHGQYEGETPPPPPRLTARPGPPKDKPSAGWLARSNGKGAPQDICAYDQGLEVRTGGRGRRGRREEEGRMDREC